MIARFLARAVGHLAIRAQGQHADGFTDDLHAPIDYAQVLREIGRDGDAGVAVNDAGAKQVPGGRCCSRRALLDRLGEDAP